MNFINNGTDDEILKSLPVEGASDDLIKAMVRQGLVQKEVQVKTKNGVITRKQWVKASQDQPADKPVKKPEESVKTSASGVKYDKKSTSQNDDIDSKFEKENGQKFKDMIAGGKVNEVSPYPGQKGYTYLNYTDKDGKNQTVSLKASPKKIRELLKDVKQNKDIKETAKDAKPEKTDKKLSSIQIPTGSSSKGKIQEIMRQNNLSAKDVMAQAKSQGVQWKESSDDFDNWANFISAVESSTDSKSQSTMTTPKDKASLLQMLQSGTSREDIMSQAEKDGITWKKSDHPGINWMRASMAMTGTSTKGSAKEEKATEPKTDKTSKSEKSVIGSDYTKLTTDDEAGTPEGEAHNMMVGRLKSKLSGKTPTETNIKGAAADLATATKHSLIMSARKEDIEHNTIMLNQFNKLAGNNYTMTHEDVLKDVLSSQSGASLEERGSAINKIMNEEGSNTYYNDGNGGVFSSNDNGAAVTIQPTARGNFKVSFAYSDGAKRSETYDKIDAVKAASEKFLKSN